MLKLMQTLTLTQTQTLRANKALHNFTSVTMPRLDQSPTSLWSMAKRPHAQTIVNGLLCCVFGNVVESTRIVNYLSRSRSISIKNWVGLGLFM